MTDVEELQTGYVIAHIERLGVSDALSYFERVQQIGDAAGIRVVDLLCYYDVQEKGEAEIVGIAPLMFTHAIVSGIDYSGYSDRWCFESYEAAKAALDAWDGTGEPTGWHRHPKSGRRRDKDGTETVNW